MATWWSAVRRDLRHAVRTLGRTPGFTMAAVATLGLGVGAATAMFSVVDAVLLRAPALPEASRVVALAPRAGGDERAGSPGLLAAWRAASRQLAHVAGLAPRQATHVTGGDAERISGFAASAALFDVLGVRPLLGRTFGAREDAPGAAPSVVLAHRFWTRAYGADPAVVGTTIRLDGTAHTVLGVLPPQVDALVDGSEFYVPLALPASQDANYTPYLTLVGRLAPGASMDGAARELDLITARLGAPAQDDGRTLTVRVAPLHAWIASGVRTPLLLMLGAVGVILLIGCANVATLVLVRSVGRARELALRAALGASRGRLAAQLAAEHVVLGLVASLLALPVAAAGTRLLVAWVPADVPRLAGAGIDARALAVALLLGVATSLLCGVAPALRQGRLDLQQALRAGGRGVAGGDGTGWRRALVGAEVALAVVLLAGAGLLVRSAVALARVRPGFDVEHVLTARLALPERDYPEIGPMVGALERMREAAASQPGVQGAGLVSRVPLGGSLTGIDVAPVERPLAGPDQVNVGLRIASTGYFAAIGIPLLAGRDLRPSDDARSPRVVVVNAAMAERLGGVRRAVGRRVRSDNSAFADAAGRPHELEVVGVVGDVLDGGPRSAPSPELYAPLAQVPDEPWNYWIGREVLLVTRAAGSPAALAPALRRAVAGVDPRVPLYDVRSTAERVAEATAIERFTSRLLVALGVAGLALAALGIHGVVAYLAALRRREASIRMALGATGAHVVSMVVRQGMRPVLAGLVVGLAGAAMAGRAAQSLLFGVSPLDPVTLVAAAGVLGMIALAAAWAPARGMGRVDPAVALRGE